MTKPAPPEGGQGGRSAGQGRSRRAGEGGQSRAKAAPAKTATKAKSPTGARNTRPKTSHGGSAGGGAPRASGAARRRRRRPKRPRPPRPTSGGLGNFPAKTLDKLRRLLEEERETYVRQAHDLAAEAEALAAEREPGDTQFDEESGEGDTLNVERERDLALSASATQAVEEIDRALRRMDVGELRDLRAVRQEDRRGPPRGSAVRRAVHRVQVPRGAASRDGPGGVARSGPLAVAAVIVVLDQLTKIWAVAALSDGPVEVIGTLLQFRLTRNPGGAFSLLTGLTPVLAVLAVVHGRLHRPHDAADGRCRHGLLAGPRARRGGREPGRPLVRSPGFLRGEVVDFIKVPTGRRSTSPTAPSPSG